jgi:fluoroquinolone transport system permease protein
MKALAAYRTLGAIDGRTIARDPLLRWMVVLTPTLGLLFRVAVPQIADALGGRFSFDLVAYYPLLMSFLPLMVAGMIGTVVGFLLLDQRDDQTLSALLVTPLSFGSYLLYRLGILLVACVVLAWIAMVIAGLTGTTWWQLAVSSVVAAPLAPIYALFLGAFAHNKVQGFALAKAMGIVPVTCVLAYFLAGPWQSAFGVLPHYWPLKVFWLFDVGRVSSALWHAAIGLAWQGALLVGLATRFTTVVRQ